ncbi:hypothetical protein D3C84_846700 [compost metagenome]
MGVAQGSQQRLRYRCLTVAPAGNDDGPCLFQQFQAAIGQYLNTAHGAHRPLIDGRDSMAVPREIELWPCQAKNFHGDAEFESTQAVVGQDHDQSWRSMHLAESSR